MACDPLTPLAFSATLLSLIAQLNLAGVTEVGLLPEESPPGDIAPPVLPSGEGFFETSKLPDFAKRARQATVRIGRARQEIGIGISRNETNGWGSGVVVAVNMKKRRALVASNVHVAACNLQAAGKNPTACERKVWFEDQHGKPIVGGKVRQVSLDPSSDLLLLEVELPPEASEPKPIELDDGPPIGNRAFHDPVIAIGAPGLYARPPLEPKPAGPVPPPASPPANPIRFSKGHVLATMRGLPIENPVHGGRIPQPAILHTADLLPGNSGGPLINGEGKLIGINSQIRGTGPMAAFAYCASTRNDCYNVAISAEKLREPIAAFLRKKKW